MKQFLDIKDFYRDFFFILNNRSSLFFLNIEYKWADKISGKILITDLAGRTLKTIVLTEGSLQTQVDISDLVNGVYFVNLYEPGKLSETKKIIVPK